MENEKLFDFSTYDNEYRLCVKPSIEVYEQIGYLRLTGKLGHYGHCTAPSDYPDEKLEKDFYLGKGQFDFYDIKLCHSLTMKDYERFLEEFLRRGKTKKCIIHISNSTNPDNNDEMTSLYDLNYFFPMVKELLKMENEKIVEISNKLIKPSDSEEHKKLFKLSDILYNDSSVKHYMIREEIYKRIIRNNPISPDRKDIEFLDDYVTLHEEVMRYDDLRRRDKRKNREN